MSNIIINPKYNCELINDKYILYSERDYITISDLKTCKIISKIVEGTYTEDTLIDELENDISIFELLYLLKKLKDKKIISSKSLKSSIKNLAFFEELNIDTQKINTILNEKPVSIRTINSSLDEKYFIDFFAKNNIRLDDESVLDIIITDDYSTQDIEFINEVALKKNKDWLLIKPTGTIGYIGPLFKPYISGCWKCLEQRILLNKQINLMKSSNKDKYKKKIIPSLSMATETILNFAFLEIVKYLYFGENKNIEGKIFSIDLKELKTKSHILVKRPQCLSCGKENTNKFNKRNLISLDINDSKNIIIDGGYRTVSSDETIKKYKHHVSNITGVIQTLEQIYDRKNSPVFNYFSGVNLSFKRGVDNKLNNHIRNFSGGKGKNLTQAKVGAICEALERYSSSYQGDEKVIKASYNELEKEAIYPNDCLNFSEKQYIDRIKLNSDCQKSYHMIPEKLNGNIEIDWVRINKIDNNGYKYIPASFCFFQYPKSKFCFADSNGNAAGNTIEEAILQGLFELAERDSVAIWWYNMLKCPKVNIKSFNNNYFNKLAEYYESINRILYVLDITFDLGIPSFAAVSHDNNGEKIIVGFGSHVDVNIALERALIEVNQFLPALYDERYLKDKSIINWLNIATVYNQPYLVPFEDEIKTYDDYYNDKNVSSINSVLKKSYNIFLKKGFEIYYLDMTKPDIKLPVVKVIIPGLRHFWNRFAPGRLYDVPFDMKLLTKKRTEEELNPITFFF